jgi:hypothetical protein
MHFLGPVGAVSTPAGAKLLYNHIENDVGKAQDKQLRRKERSLNTSFFSVRVQKFSPSDSCSTVSDLSVVFTLSEQLAQGIAVDFGKTVAGRQRSTRAHKCPTNHKERDI